MAQVECNILNVPDGLVPNRFTEGGFGRFDETELKLLGFAELDEDFLRVTSSALPNTVNGAWFVDELRLGDGFQAEFDFTFDAGTSDGFAFVIQDDTIVDAIGNGGPALGFSDAFERYIAVGFDFCFDRLDCTQQEVRVERKIEGGQKEVLGSFVAENIFGVLADQPISARVTVNFLADVQTVQVILNDVEVLSVQGVVLRDILADELFTFFGFTSSNAEAQGTGLAALDLSIDSFRLDQYLSKFKLNEVSLEPVTLDITQVAVFTIEVVDDCNVPLDVTGVSVDDIEAFLFDEIEGGQDVEFDRNAFVAEGTEITLLFVTGQVPTSYTLQVKVQGVLVQQNPLVQHVITVQPANQGLGVVGIAILASVLSILALIAVGVALGWNNYRRKLNTHAEDIEYGKTKKKIDTIDKTIEYEMNPMIAPLDKLKERLAANEQTISELKESQQNAIDSDYTVEQLQEENRALRQEMQELKRKQEYENAGNRMSANFRQRMFGKKDKRDDFGQYNA